LSLSLDIDLLRSFIAVAESRALSRAANRIGRTQSALSQQMKRLEESSISRYSSAPGAAWC
jgi:DNA-binding transcriptional LysR family regulator